jgi:hypothetical protein
MIYSLSFPIQPDVSADDILYRKNCANAAPRLQKRQNPVIFNKIRPAAGAGAEGQSARIQCACEL